MKKIKSAFSLIELSIVILIIGILILGITKGKRIINEAKLKTALTLTAGSPVVSMSGVVLWLDATDSTTIATGSAGSGVFTNNLNDGDLVTDWKDRNPQNTTHIIFSAVANGNRPVYVKNGINSLPSLQFDGANYFLQNSDPNGVVAAGKTNYSAVIVFAKSSNAQNFYTFFDQGNGACNGGDFDIGLHDTGGGIELVGCGAGGAGDYGTSLAPNLNSPSYLIMRVNKDQPTNRVKTNLNNTITNVGTIGITSLGGGPTYIGQTFQNIRRFQGNISEIIIFDRAITDSETVAIQRYLSAKYGVK